MSNVDKIVLGTAGLGQDYGVPTKTRKPISKDDAKRFIRRAHMMGVNIFDTAPIYGDSEAKLGDALGNSGVVWTKCGPIANVDDINSTIDRSFGRLNRDTIDLMQWHFWTPDVMKERCFNKVWDAIGNNGRIKLRGATTYGVYNALSAVNSGMFDVVQVEWNLLNQNVINYISKLSDKKGTKIAVRSVFLKGVLTSGMIDVPEFLAPLLKKRELAKTMAKKYNMSLEQLAVAAALENKNIDYVIVGASKNRHLDSVLDIVEASGTVNLDEVGELNCQSNDLVDTRVWEVL